MTDNAATKAYRIAHKHFPDAPDNELRQAIALCERADGLFITENLSLAFFRYHPGMIVDGKRMFEIVKDWDGETLNKLDLRDGPIVHVMFFSCPKGSGYRIFRRLMDSLHIQGVSGHRIKNGERFFILRAHRRVRNETQA